LLLTQNSIHEKVKSPEGEPRIGANTLEDAQGLNQTGGSVAKLNLEQNQPNSPKTGFRTSFRTGSGTSSRTVSEPISPSIPARVKSVSVDPLTPRPRKHQSSHPLDQILSDINTGVQTRSKLKNFCAFYALLSNIEQKNVNEAVADSNWVSAMEEELHQFEKE